MPSTKAIHRDLLAWYHRHGRELPWRKNKDAYRIWISEIMLQQTRVEAVIPYYERFLAKFPTPQHLAKAHIDEVTKLWAGLGYYSRARNIHKAAEQICKNHNGSLPKKYEDLLELSGIGPYTAAAIASMAYDLSHPAIDGNLAKVLARLLALEKNPKTDGAKEIQSFAETLVGEGNAGDVNQALMDLSATICFSANPKCIICPIQKHCKAFDKNLTDKIPFKPARKKAIDLQSSGVIIFRKSPKQKNDWEILLHKRAKGFWLQGMWDIPWRTENETALKFPIKKLKKIGETVVTRTITKHRIRFHVSFYEAPKIFQWKSTEESRWLNIYSTTWNLPKPTEKALQVAIKQL